MKRISIHYLSLFLVAALLALTVGSPSVNPAHAAGNILYAQPTSIGSGDCSTWANACDLQTALATAASGDQIWGRWGTYYPTSGTDRTVSFQLKNGVAIYGGFLSGAAQLSQRDPSAYPSILNGDIGQKKIKSDNSYRVVVSSGNDNTTLLDGFTITQGYADGASGGGIYIDSSSLTLTNVIISNNHSINGGGMYNLNSNPTLTDVLFLANSATNGGGMCNDSSSPSLTDVLFLENFATGAGGGMFNVQSSPTLTNVTFSKNSVNSGVPLTKGTPPVGGGGMFNTLSNPTLTNVTFSGNSSAYGGGMFNTQSSSPTLTNVNFLDNIVVGNYCDAGSYCGGIGAGMYNDSSSSPTITNVTFSGNVAAAVGGGMVNRYSNPTITNVTFSGNSAPAGGGGIINTGSSPTLINVIIADTLSGGDCINSSPGDPVPLNAASKNNLIEDSSNACGLTDGVAGNIIGQDPLLGVLGDNGGFNQTLALLPGSPAIDAGDDSVSICDGDPADNFDQRGETRPQGAHCDIGAYEVSVDGTPPSVDSITRADPTNPTVAQSLNFTVTFSEPVSGVDMSDFSLTVSGNVSGASVTNLSGSGDTYTVSVDRGSGEGTIRLDMNASGTGIEDLASNPISGGFTSGESYTILKTTTTSITGHTPNPSFVGQPVPVTYTVTSGAGTPTGNVTVSDGTVSCTASVAAGTCDITFTNTGSKSLTATYAGDSNFAASASDPVAHNVINATLVSLSSSSSPILVVGDTADFTATVAPSGVTFAPLAASCALSGNVTFKDGATTLDTVSVDANCQAQFSTTSLALGTHQISAEYSGDANYAAAISNQVTVIVNPAPTPLSASFPSLGAYDGYLLESGENTNIGGSGNATGGTFTLGDDAYRKQYRSLLHFNTSSLPDGAVITGLTLQIKKQGGSGTNPFTALGNLQVDISMPFFGTGSGLAVSDFQAAPGASNVGMFNPAPLAGNWYSAVLGNTAFPFLNLTGSTQVRLAFSVDDNNNSVADTLRFFSGNYATASYRPVLIVEYYVP